MTCPVAWALEEPNEEDSAMGVMHRCVIHNQDHGRQHRCRCGETYTEPDREPWPKPPDSPGEG